MRPAPSRHRDYAKRFEIAPAPAKDYLKDKKIKKKSAKTAAWFLIFGFVIFGLLMAKLALSNSRSRLTGIPDSDTAYDIARQYIMPTVRTNHVYFADDNYKFAKQSDSVYVIKSSYTTKFVDGINQTKRFTITLKYKGGMAAKIGNWDLIDLDQD